MIVDRGGEMSDGTNYGLIGQILLEHGLITATQLEDALEKQKETGMSLGGTLVDLGFVCEDDFMKTISSQVGMEVVDLEKIEPSREAVDKLSSSILLKTEHQMLIAHPVIRARALGPLNYIV